MLVQQASARLIWQSWMSLAKANNTGILIAPKLALGAILMIKLACQAAKYFPNVEIIERHHDKKLDAPSRDCGYYSPANRRGASGNAPGTSGRKRVCWQVPAALIIKV